MNRSLVNKLIALEHSVIIGSQAFGVSRADSDTDIAILFKDLPEEFSNDAILDIRRYFNILPLGNSWLIRRSDLDLLLYEKIEDINTLKDCVELMKCIPLEILEVKELRVKIFETMLLNRGFKDSNCADLVFR